jgi:hypothetical protein
VVAALAALALIAGQWDLDAAGTSESRAGEAPLVVGQPSRGFVAQIVRPSAELQYRSGDSTLRFDYGPRIFWQTPNAVDASGPLILHTASLTLNASADRRVSFTLQALGSIGQPDY